MRSVVGRLQSILCISITLKPLLCRGGHCFGHRPFCMLLTASVYDKRTAPNYAKPTSLRLVNYSCSPSRVVFFPLEADGAREFWPTKGLDMSTCECFVGPWNTLLIWQVSSRYHFEHGRNCVSVNNCTVK